MAHIGPTRQWLARTTAAAVVVGSMTALSADLATAQASPAVTKATVVKIVTRKHFGKILATIHGRALYYKPTGTCTGMCLSFWPPLLMPKGATKPVGTKCLETAKFGSRLQVTYRDHRLYRFSGDSGKSVKGNGVAGFKVAKFSTASCP